MQIREVYYTPQFQKSWRKLPKKIKTKAKGLGKVFRKNCFDKRLKTHKLSGKLKDKWSFSVSYQYRIVFKFINTKKVVLLDIGTHQIYC